MPEKQVEPKSMDSLPPEVLSLIFSLLPPDTQATSRSVCKLWLSLLISPLSLSSPPWFLAMAPHDCRHHCYARNPRLKKWHSLSLLPSLPANFCHPVSGVGGLLLCRNASSNSLSLSICEPFFGGSRILPPLLSPRRAPALAACVTQHGLQVCVAGGASSSGYERTVEVYKSWIGSWCHAGEVPDRLAGRLAVWAGGEGVWCGGVVYWMTSARPFRVVNWKGGCIWGEVEVPTGGLIGCSGLVEREGNVALVGGDGFGGVCVWELKGEGEWSEVGRVPRDMVGRLVKRGAGTHKCVAGEGVVYVYGESREGVVVWRKREKEWEWELGEGLELGCGGEKGFPIKGVVVQPGLMASCVDSF